MTADGWGFYDDERKRLAEAEKHAKDPVLYNAEAIDGAAELLWCDGIAQVEAAADAGIAAPVAALGGLGRIDPLRPHAEALERVNKHVLAISDVKLREELARRLGRHRCWVMDWPKDGKIGIFAIGFAEPWPIEGVHRVKEGLLQALRKRPPPATMTTGCRSTDAVIRFPCEGRLIVVTGWPSSGKTSWTKFVAVHTATDCGRRWGVFSPESQPWEQFAAACAEVFIGKPFYPKRDPGWQAMDDAEIAHAERWLESRMIMVVCDAEAETPTLDWLLERMRAVVLRDGVTDFLIDPWNEIAHEIGKERETVYIGQALSRLRSFAFRHGCNIWIVAHPAKPERKKPGEKLPAPGPSDIDGCYSADTEVLTDRGWLPHPSVDIDRDLICCFDPAGRVLRYEAATHLHDYVRDGEMHHYTGYGLDLMVTPTHRMVVRGGWDHRAGKNNGRGRPPRWSHKEWQFAESRALPNASFRIPLAAACEARVSDAVIPGVADQDAAWEFVGWFVSEGWMQMAAPMVCQAIEASGAIRTCMDRLGLRYSTQVACSGRDNEKPMWRGRIYRREAENFCDWIAENCGDGCANKRLPQSTWELAMGRKRLLFDALIAGDGHRPPAGLRKRKPGCSYSTISRKLADDVQRLAVELGHYAHVRTERPGKAGHSQRYTVVIGHETRTERVIVLPRNRQQRDYSGRVYCLTVPTGAYVTRRNGKMAICGNSAHWWNKSDIGVTIHVPDADLSMVEFHVWKSRFRWWGRRGRVAEMEFERVTGRYSSPAVENAEVST